MSNLHQALENMMADLTESYGVTLPDHIEVFDQIRELLVDHPPATAPTRDQAADVIRERGWTCDMHEPDPECDTCGELHLATADAVLALHPGRTETVVKAEALRQAAKTLDWTEGDEEYDRIRGWLNDRADRIENGNTP